MTLVFADTAFWLARVCRRDQWHEAATAAHRRLGKGAKLVTTQEVLAELLTTMASSGPDARAAAIAAVQKIAASDEVTVVEQSAESFWAGFALYASHLDKRYSMTDCISMATMRARGLTDVLTSDRHFAQEGFQPLMAREES